MTRNLEKERDDTEIYKRSHLRAHLQTLRGVIYKCSHLDLTHLSISPEYPPFLHLNILQIEKPQHHLDRQC